MTATAERLFAARASAFFRRRPEHAPERREETPAVPVALERIDARLRAELDLPAPEPDLTSVLERLRLR